MGLRALALMLLFTPAAAATAEEPVDLAAIHRIKQEAFAGSKVMDHMFYLTDVNGPRLTNSPGQRSASEWAVSRLKSWGIGNARLEAWGTFGRGWKLDRFSMHMVEPTYAPLQGIPLAWTSGTAGDVRGPVVLAPVFTQEELKRGDQRDPTKLAARIESYAGEHRGMLRGKIVLMTPPRELTEPTDAASQRYDADRLAEIAKAPVPFAAPPIRWPIVSLPEDPNRRHELMASLPLEVRADLWMRGTRLWSRLDAFYHDEGVIAALSGDNRGSGGITFAEEGGSWEKDAPTPPPMVSLPPEPYDRLCRLAQQGRPAVVELDDQVTFYDDDLVATNVIAEIPGGSRKDEIVMLGAHLDSWHAGTGATDNAAGSAVALEAMRILKTLALPMNRTVRLALWTGEEQGLFGSRAYVKKHFADPVTMQLLPEHAKLAAYFNLDNGTGKIRGIYLQGNDMVRPIFTQWLAPFADLGASTITIDDTGGTDHLSFDAVGLPGFQFIQDPLDYGSRTHHSNLDVYDHVQPGDLMQAAAIMASFVYEAATRPDMLPRKPLPRPLPPKIEGIEP